jgi:hypothetical protein
MGRMIIDEKNWNQKRFRQVGKVVQIGAKTVNPSASLQCGLVNDLLKICLKSSGNQLIQNFHLYFFFSCPNLSFSQPSDSLKMNIEAFGKNQFSL